MIIFPYLASGSSGSLPPTTNRIVAGTTYTLVNDDAGNSVEFTSNSPITLTVPAGLAGDGNDVKVYTFEQKGTGVVTVVGALGVTINANANHTKSGGIFAVFGLLCKAPNTYSLTGTTAL